MKKILEFIKLMRPQHYMKNILIFLPIIFSKNLLNVELLKITLIGFLSFSFMASIVYILNDIMDAEADKKHEKKKFRPIASGKISIKSALILMIILLILSLLLNIYIKADIVTYTIFYGYLIMNILYSIKLKHIPIIDIVILSFGFLLRVLYGSAITEIPISNWLYLTILAFSFYMGLGKRRNELKKMGNGGRKVLEYYNQSFLDNNMYMCVALGIVFYSLWCIDINTTINSIINIVWTVPLVIIICMKYSLNIEGNSSGDPVDVILNDKVLIILALIYAAIMFATIYLQ